MIVAGTEMHVVAQAVALAADHQAHLRMGLELDEAEHHLDPCPLQVARPLDVGLLVETGLELDQRGHGLAGLRGLGESADDGRLLGCPVERLLDRENVRVARRLTQELHDDVE